MYTESEKPTTQLQAYNNTFIPQNNYLQICTPPLKHTTFCRAKYFIHKTCSPKIWILMVFGRKRTYWIRQGLAW